MAVLFRPALLATLVVALAGCGNQQIAEQTPNLQPAALQQTAQNSRTVPNRQNVTNQTGSNRDTRPVIAVFGDSLSAGFGVDAGKSYPDDLQRLLDAAGYRYRIVNLGVSGDTTTDGVERLPTVLAVHPAIAIVEFGGNDGLRGLPVESAKKNLGAMVVALQKANAKILLAGMTLPRNYGPEYIQSFERMYVDLTARYKLVLIPFLLEGVGGHPDLMQPDGIHPTAEGARIVAVNVLKYLQPLLTKNSVQ